MPDIVQQAKDNARAGRWLALKLWMIWTPAFKDADVVYPKSWGSWVTTEDEAESVADRQKI